MLASVVLVSATQQCKSAIIVHIPPPCRASLPSLHPPFEVITEPQAGLPLSYSSFSPAIHFTHNSVYVDAYFPHQSHCLPCCVHKSILCICISIPSLQIGSSVPFFSIPYICINILYLFFFLIYFTLCNLGLSTLIELAQIYSFFMAE